MAELVARILTDNKDEDIEDQRELVIFPHENGWCIDVVEVGKISQNPVCIYRHGAKAKNPVLAEFIGGAYYSIMQKQHPDQFPTRDNFASLLEEIIEWRGLEENSKPLRIPSSTSDDFAVFKTDDDTVPESSQKSLHIGVGGNGDWYIQAMSEDNGDYRGVRLATSGGISWRYPYVCANIAYAYHAIQNPFPVEEIISYDEAVAEVEMWRNKYPDKEYDGIYIGNKLVDDLW